jgi:hypothetical protein
MARPSKKDYKQDEAIAAFLSSASVRQAAQAAGISHHTLHAWLRDPAFRAQFSQARAEVLHQAIGHIANALVAAALVLRSIMLDADAPASARVAAAKSVFELALKDMEISQLQERLAAFEAALVQIQGASGHA